MGIRPTTATEQSAPNFHIPPPPNPQSAAQKNAPTPIPDHRSMTVRHPSTLGHSTSRTPNFRTASAVGWWSVSIPLLVDHRSLPGRLVVGYRSVSGRLLVGLKAPTAHVASSQLTPDKAVANSAPH